MDWELKGLQGLLVPLNLRQRKDGGRELPVSHQPSILVCLEFYIRYSYNVILRKEKSMPVKIGKQKCPSGNTVLMKTLTLIGAWVPLDEYYYGKKEGDPAYREEKGEFRFKVSNL